MLTLYSLSAKSSSDSVPMITDTTRSAEHRSKSSLPFDEVLKLVMNTRGLTTAGTAPKEPTIIDLTDDTEDDAIQLSQPMSQISITNSDVGE